MPEERRYSDREVAALIARAVELSRAPSPAPRAEGTSLAELERIGAEAGLDPSLLRRAAAELEPGGPGPRGRLSVSARASADRQPDEKELSLLCMDLPDLAGFAGNGNASGSLLVWRGDGATEANSGRAFRLELRPSPEGGSSIEARFDLRKAAIGLYGGLVGGFGLGTGLSVGLSLGLGPLHSPLFAALFPLGSFALSFGISWLLVKALVRDSRKRAEKIVEAVRERLATRIP